MNVCALVVLLLLIYIFFFDGYTSSGPVVELHYVNWCGACKRMKPVWSSVKGTIPGVQFVEIDEDIAKTKGITGYPTILMKSNGRTYKYSGAPDPRTLSGWIRNNM